MSSAAPEFDWSPSRRTSVTVGRVDVNYKLTAPAAKRAVLFHGAVGSLYYWEPFARLLCDRGYQVLAFDWPGRGFSPFVEGAYDLAFHLSLVDGLLDTLSFRPPYAVFGHSMGGCIGLHFAEKKAKDVSSLVMVSPAIFMTLPIPRFLQGLIASTFVWVVSFISSASHLRGDFYPPPSSRFMGDIEGDELPETKKKQFLLFRALTEKIDQFQADGKRKALSRMMAAFDPRTAANEPAAVRVAQTEIPVLILWGDKDLGVSFEQCVPICKRIFNDDPRHRIVAVEDSAHTPFVENAEGCTSALSKFMHDHSL